MTNQLRRAEALARQLIAFIGKVLQQNYVSVVKDTAPLVHVGKGDESVSKKRLFVGIVSASVGFAIAHDASRPLDAGARLVPERVAQHLFGGACTYKTVIVNISYCTATCGSALSHVKETGGTKSATLETCGTSQSCKFPVKLGSTCSGS